MTDVDGDMVYDAYEKRIDADTRGLEAVDDYLYCPRTMAALRKVYEYLADIVDELKETYELAANIEQADDDVLPEHLLTAQTSLASIIEHAFAVCDQCAAKQTIADFERHDGKCLRCRNLK